MKCEIKFIAHNINKGWKDMPIGGWLILIFMFVVSLTIYGLISMYSILLGWAFVAAMWLSVYYQAYVQCKRIKKEE